MRKLKIAVVGAGPSGGACAIALRRLGVGEVLLFDKSRYPRVKVCGSGLSPLALKQLGKLNMLDRYPDHASIQGLVAKGPGGRVRAMRGGGKGAWVVPRHEFDHSLAMEALKLGAEFYPETKVTELLTDPDGEVRGIDTTQGQFEADLVVCADGSAGRFSTDNSPRETIRTIMGWWEGTTLPQDEAVIVWDRRLEGYYAWSFPEPGGVVNIGLTIPSTAPHAKRLKALFAELLDEHFAYGMKSAQQRGKWMGHPAVVSTKVGTIATQRTISVGEAARLVMPGTVEGIGFALESGIYAANFLAKSFHPHQGLSRLDRARYRASSAARVVPKFLAGEGFVRLMRSPRATRAFGAVMNDRVSKVVINAAARMTGDAIEQEAQVGPAGA